MAGENPRSDDDALARERRLQALRALAQQQTSAPAADPSATESSATRSDSAAPPTPAHRQGTPGADLARMVTYSRQPRRHGRLLVVTLCALLCVLVASGLALRAFTSRTARNASGSAPNTVKIVTLASGVACPSALAWSPDGTRIAVVGYAKVCPSEFPTNYQYEPGIVGVYDAATGRLLGAFQPDKPVQQVPGMPTPGSVTPAVSSADTSSQVVNYSDILWSPDGKKLALRFAVSTYSIGKASFGADVNYQGGATGLEITNVDGSQAHVITYNAHGGNYSALRWDVTADSVTPINPVRGTGPENYSITPAYSYSWGADGTLQPGTPLASDTQPTQGPIGNPDGGSSFSMWQPGTATYQNVAFINNQQVPENPGTYTFSTGFLAWSPDGRYIFDSLYLDGLVQPHGRPAPTAKALKDFGLNTAPHLLMRDQGMEQAFESLPATVSGGASLSLAWRPDGRVLAAQAQRQSNAQASGSAVVLYDCRTGAKLGELTPIFDLQGSDLGTGQVNALLWSPDGSHLLVLDAQSATITIWGAGKLPK